MKLSSDLFPMKLRRQGIRAHSTTRILEAGRLDFVFCKGTFAIFNPRTVYEIYLVRTVGLDIPTHVAGRLASCLPDDRVPYICFPGRRSPLTLC
jgi:hypothetical protein